MKKLLATIIILIQLSSPLMAAIPVAAILGEPASGTVSVYNLSELFTVVVDNTMLSLKEIAALAGLVNEAAPLPKDNSNSPADKAAANPAGISQALRVSLDFKDAAKVFTQCGIALSDNANLYSNVSPGYLMWLLFGCMLILMYRLKLFYNSARSAIDFYNATALTLQAIFPRFVKRQIGVFLYVSSHLSLAIYGRGQGEGENGGEFPC
jgi:hypothetical protein